MVYNWWAPCVSSLFNISAYHSDGGCRFLFYIPQILRNVSSGWVANWNDYIFLWRYSHHFNDIWWYYEVEFVHEGSPGTVEMTKEASDVMFSLIKPAQHMRIFPKFPRRVWLSILPVSILMVLVMSIVVINQLVLILTWFYQFAPLLPVVLLSPFEWWC